MYVCLCVWVVFIGRLMWILRGVQRVCGCAGMERVGDVLRIFISIAKGVRVF